LSAKNRKNRASAPVSVSTRGGTPLRATSPQFVSHFGMHPGGSAGAALAQQRFASEGTSK
jgi:hypothetical protein